jgi:hypothetical protein
MLVNCIDCKESKEDSEFHKNKAKLNGLMNCCKQCKKIRAKTSNDRHRDTIKKYNDQYKPGYYRRNRARLLNQSKNNKASPLLYLRRLFRCINYRCNNPKQAAYKYYGARGIKILVDRDSFVEWALQSKKFLRLHKHYVKSNFTYKLAPSIDRIDSTKHYSFDNMQWLTVSQNSSKR